MEAGAVACIEKPVSSASPHFAERSANLLQTVRLMSEVKVVRRWARPRPNLAVVPAPEPLAGELLFETTIATTIAAPRALRRVRFEMSMLPPRRSFAWFRQVSGRSGGTLEGRHDFGREKLNGA